MIKFLKNMFKQRSAMEIYISNRSPVDIIQVEQLIREYQIRAFKCY
jgi:hypothetical protein